MSADYKETLNLPKTDFPMKANLSVREPEMVRKWDEAGIYKKIVEKNRKKTPFILHDGPPYANGSIHFGHILNKVLKDIVFKYRSMSGHFTEFVPGWDCHGLPIEIHVEKKMGKSERDVVKIRKECRRYALKYVDIQRDEFKRIGILGDWDSPYLTLNHSYEAVIAREFGKFVKGGYIYKGRKPVFWCASCRTALAEAEVEYADHTSPSIYVKFALNDPAAVQALSPDGVPVFAVIWTTTPWTIPSNLAIALNSSFKYLLVEIEGERWLIAEALLEPMMKEIGITDYKIVRDVNPVDIEKAKFKHPLVERDSIIILGDHVTMDAGTGCVHTAPGHGREDYEIGARYGLAAFAPIDDTGCFTKEAGLPYLEGIYVEKANPLVNEKLKTAGALVWEGKVTHSYPHCWRCKQPIIFRSTEQWFISLEHAGLRKKSLAEIDKVSWIPKWGRERIYGMVEARPDWCISRQRVWGVPIIVVRCKACGEDIMTGEIVDAAAAVFERCGSDSWFTEPVETFLPKKFCCPKCGGKDFQKGRDIIDVWFESGISYAAVIERRPGGYIPVDLYLEGSDQHRGWFHSALLTSVATRGISPYKACLTHGFVVDSNGKKYSKSAGNYVPPEKVLKTSGAEILRLWVAAEDYRNDIKVSDEIFNRLAEAYRKIRNTLRFLLGNIGDFDPAMDVLDRENLEEIDKWILHRLQILINKCITAYEEYQYHVIYHALNEFCVVDLSAFYLDILKDRLYCEKRNGRLRRSAQTAMWRVLDAIVRLMAPILSFTADEVWEMMPAFEGKEESVFLADMPRADEALIDDELAAKWSRFMKIRAAGTKILEIARADKVIGNSLEAKLVIKAGDGERRLLESFGAGLADLFIVSQCDFGEVSGQHVYESDEMPGLFLSVLHADGEKCARCWKYFTDSGRGAENPGICNRCLEVICHSNTK